MRSLLSLPVLALAGCFTYPCDTDVLACEDGDALQIDPECKADGDLDLQARENDDEAIAPDAWPTVHHGAQGALHFDLALRVLGLDPDHHQVEITLKVQACDDQTCKVPTEIASRTLVADDEILEPDGDALELHDLVLVLEHEPPTPGRLVVELRDACGRTMSKTYTAAAQ